LDKSKAYSRLNITIKAGFYGLLVAILLYFIAYILTTIYLLWVLDIIEVPAREFITGASWAFTLRSILLIITLVIVFLVIVISKFMGLQPLSMLERFIVIRKYTRALLLGIIVFVSVIVYAVYMAPIIYSIVYKTIASRDLFFIKPWDRFYYLWMRPGWIYSEIKQLLFELNVAVLVATLFFLIIILIELVALRTLINRLNHLGVISVSLSTITLVAYSVLKVLNITSILLELVALISLLLYAYGNSKLIESLQLLLV